MKNNQILYTLVFAIILLVTTACKQETEKSDTTVSTDKAAFEETHFRPNFHFTPKVSWMNDPNGMFYSDGVYHLYFQYYPEDNVWGPMHWGHATSKDMVVWEEQPIAIYPDSIGYIFSGGAVVDHLNTSGFGTADQPAVVATFTYHDPKGEKSGAIDFQSQAIAYSLDGGFNWTKYQGNPVIPNPGIKDFRDPKVSWDEERKQWVMALATYSETLFYGSPDLKSWSLLSAFGKDIGAHGGVWECPDFIKMRVEGTDETRWVLLQSLNPGSANGGSGTQYFVGDFDGTTFTLDPGFKERLESDEAVWLDYGRDNYAGVTWSSIPEEDGRTLFIGWMSNWDYAQEVPTTTWRSAMTLARELTLHQTDRGYEVHSNPVSEFDNYTSILRKLPNIKPQTALIEPEDGLENGNIKIEFEFRTDLRQDWMIEFSNDEDNNLMIGYDDENEWIYVDRSGTGRTDFSEKFANQPTVAPVYQWETPVHVEIYLDKTSIEIFLNDGEVVVTDIFFTDDAFNQAYFEATDPSVTLTDVVISEIQLPE